MEKQTDIKIPYNTYVDNDGYVVPKNPIIKNTPEIVQWLRENTRGYSQMPGTSDSFHPEDEWLVVGISCSRSGYVFRCCYTAKDEDVKKFYSTCNIVKIFDNDIQGFKRYMLWTEKVRNRKFSCQLKRNDKK